MPAITMTPTTRDVRGGVQVARDDKPVPGPTPVADVGDFVLWAFDPYQIEKKGVLGVVVEANGLNARIAVIGGDQGKVYYYDYALPAWLVRQNRVSVGNSGQGTFDVILRQADVRGAIAAVSDQAVLADALESLVQRVDKLTEMLAATAARIKTS